MKLKTSRRLCLLFAMSILAAFLGCANSGTVSRSGPERFCLIVRDAYGAPVPYASLVARLPDGGHALSSTDRDGRAAFRLPCPASACSLEVVQPAYLPYTGPLAPAVTLRGRCSLDVTVETDGPLPPDLRAAVLPPTISERIVFTPAEGLAIEGLSPLRLQGPKFTITGLGALSALLVVWSVEGAAAGMTPVTPDPDGDASYSVRLRKLHPVTIEAGDSPARWADSLGLGISGVFAPIRHVSFPFHATKTVMLWDGSYFCGPEGFGTAFRVEGGPVRVRLEGGGKAAVRLTRIEVLDADSGEPVERAVVLEGVNGNPPVLCSVYSMEPGFVSPERGVLVGPLYRRKKYISDIDRVTSVAFTAPGYETSVITLPDPDKGEEDLPDEITVRLHKAPIFTGRVEDPYGAVRRIVFHLSDRPKNDPGYHYPLNDRKRAFFVHSAPVGEDGRFSLRLPEAPYYRVSLETRDGIFLYCGTFPLPRGGSAVVRTPPLEPYTLAFENGEDRYGEYLYLVTEKAPWRAVQEWRPERAPPSGRLAVLAPPGTKFYSLAEWAYYEPVPAGKDGALEVFRLAPRLARFHSAVRPCLPGSVRLIYSSAPGGGVAMPIPRDGMLVLLRAESNRGEVSSGRSELYAKGDTVRLYGCLLVTDYAREVIYEGTGWRGEEIRARRTTWGGPPRRFVIHLAPGRWKVAVDGKEYAVTARENMVIFLPKSDWWKKEIW